MPRLMHILQVLSCATVLLCAAGAKGEEATPAGLPPSSVDLLDLPALETAGLATAPAPAASVWSGGLVLETASDGAPVLVAQERTIPGGSGHFPSSLVDWTAYGELRLTVELPQPGNLGLLFTEEDGDRRETYVVNYLDQAAGTQTLTVKLAPAPAGDLVSCYPPADGEWNPTEDFGVLLRFGPYPSGFRVSELQLIGQADGKEGQ